MNNKVFPKRTKLRHNFPDIQDFDANELPNLIRQQLILLGDNPEKPCNILLIPPYKPDAGDNSSTNKNLVGYLYEMVDWGNEKLAETPYKLVNSPHDILMLSGKRLANGSPLLWSRPAWAFPTTHFENRPEQHALIIDDFIYSGGTLMALHHACAVAGKKVLAAFGQCDYTDTRLLLSSPEQRQALQTLLPNEEDRRAADVMLAKIGLSLDTLTGEEMFKLLKTEKTTAEWLDCLNTIVSEAYDKYEGPQDSLKFLRNNAKWLTKQAVSELDLPIK